MIMKVLVDEQLVCASEDKAGKSMVTQLHLDLPKALVGGQRDLVTSILWATVSALRDVLDLVETFRESGEPNGKSQVPSGTRGNLDFLVRSPSNALVSGVLICNV